jgi:sulfate permease, SulP family
MAEVSKKSSVKEPMLNQLSTAAGALKPDRRNLGADLIAGLTFAVVNVPQSMAHALLATVNPVLGIYTLMVAVPVGALFTSSVFMNVSTTSALSVAVGAGLEGIPDPDKVTALAVLVLLVGVIQLLAGLFRLGFLLRFVSNAVMTGFLNGIAVLIILGQLGDLTGFDSVFRNNVARALELMLRIGQVDLPTTVLGLLTLGIIVLLLVTPLRKFAFIIAIVVATLLLTLLTLPVSPVATGFAAVETVGDVATIPRSLPLPALPPLDMLLAMLLPAFAVAMIGLIQGAGVSQGTPNPDGKFPNVSRDFFGQGVANLATSFVSGLPAGGSISGTALLMGAGAQSRWANIVSGFFVALIVLVVAPLVERVPMPALAALLIVAGFQGLRIPQAMVVWRTGRVPATIMIITFIATLFVPLQYAVLLGIVFSVVLHVFRQANQVVVTEWVPQPQGFPIEQPAPAQLPSQRFVLLNIYGNLFFAAAKNLEEMLPEVGDATRPVVIIGMRGHDEVGSTFINVLQRYAQSLQAQGGRLMLAGVDARVRTQLAKTGLLGLIGEENVFPATPQLGEAMNQAVATANAWLGEPPKAER